MLFLFSKEKHDRWIDGIYDWKSGKWRWAMTGQPLKYMGFAKQITHNKSRQDFEWGSIFMDPKLDNQYVKSRKFNYILKN